MALKEDLSYTCPSSGVTFHLLPVPPLNFDDFSIAYDETYPPPNPPMMEINVAGKTLLQPDNRDPYFVNELSRWASKKEAAIRHFLFARGIADDPPPDYAPNELLYTGNLSKGKLKALWVSDQLHTADDISGLVEAINSIMSITDAGLDASKKNTTPAPAAFPSGNGTSSLIPTP